MFWENTGITNKHDYLLVVLSGRIKRILEWVDQDSSSGTVGTETSK